ncbi:hypothetical protein B0H16DRAFT_688978 [Mycena metata]|uniref:Uncharacterized protein n=1 Tax=Mycena metata TaxID=1033252 RepID=A0AAD7J5L6_9AGAR|nr:hypothetical protein B0H16DRAFT_688978 [Mycena metata]
MHISLSFRCVWFGLRHLSYYLEKDPSWTSLSDRIVCLIGRVNISAKFHYVAYGPTSCYDRPTNKWIEGSDLASSHGGTRELFIGCKAGVEYVGSYRCHNLDALHPGGTQIPSNISASKILDIALGVRRPTEQVVRRRYLDGQIKVVATGLEYVGFNNQLYDFLRKRIADDRAELHDVTQLGKRKACDAGLRQGAKTKFRKTS